MRREEEGSRSESVRGRRSEQRMTGPDGTSDWVTLWSTQGELHKRIGEVDRCRGGKSNRHLYQREHAQSRARESWCFRLEKPSRLQNKANDEKKITSRNMGAEKRSVLPKEISVTWRAVTVAGCSSF